MKSVIDSSNASSRNAGAIRSVLMIAGLAGLLCGAAPAAHATDTGTLKLKVNRCLTVEWISGATVAVTVTRGGTFVDSGTGTTNSSGYVEMTFTTLQDGDQANIEITPSGESTDKAHACFWVSTGRNSGLWDLGMLGSSLCSDGWYDESANIMLLHYDDSGN